MPPMTVAQEQAWTALLDLGDVLDHGWTVVGGQMVHLHCAERGAAPPRPTEDADAALDVRARPQVLLDFTTALVDAGFRSAGESMDGHQHRWVRDRAQIDVLIPTGLGPRGAGRRGATGGTTVPAPGAQQAIDRTAWVDVSVADRRGRVPRPSLLGALVIKAAAHSVAGDRGRQRHVDDFSILLGLAGRSDLDARQLTRRDVERLTHMAGVLRTSGQAAFSREAADGLERLHAVLARWASPRTE